MFIKTLAAFAIAAALSLGCDQAPPVDLAASAASLPICASHGGNYEFHLGDVIDGGGLGCLFAPETGAVILPDSSDCETSDTVVYTHPLDKRIVISDTARCQWSADGDRATCILSEVASENGVSCSSTVALSYSRVPVVAW